LTGEERKHIIKTSEAMVITDITEFIGYWSFLGVKIKTRVRYAVRLMADIMKYGGDGTVPLKDVAARQNLSKRYLSQLAIHLKNAQLLKSVWGMNGGIPVVVVTGITGQGGSEDTEKFLKSRGSIPPPDGFIAKPIDNEELISMIGGLLNGS